MTRLKTELDYQARKRKIGRPSSGIWTLPADILPGRSIRQKEADIESFKLAENAVMVRLIEKLPEAIRGEYRLAWREFFEVSTEEARLVRGADKLEMIMQASEYQQEMGDPGKLMRFRHVSVEGDLEKRRVVLTIGFRDLGGGGVGLVYRLGARMDRLVIVNGRNDEIFCVGHDKR